MTTSTAHAGTQAGVGPVLLGWPHCGTPVLLLRIETPIPVTVTQPRPVRPRRLHRPPGRAHPRRGTRTPRPRRPMHLLRLEHPAANFPDHLTPAGQ